MPQLIKLPQAIYDQTHPTHGLKAGDIVITYQNPRSNKLTDKIISGFQSLWNEQGGHRNAEHGALVVELDGKLKLAHLLSTGFVLEDLNTKRTKHIYRIKNESDRIAIANELNQIIAEQKNFFKEKIFWRYYTTVMTFIRRSFNSIGIKNASLVNEPKMDMPAGIETNSICTKFVAESMLEAIFRVNTKENLSEQYMNIHSMTAPKTFQAYLERNFNYETFIVPQAGEQLYKTVKSMIPITEKTTALHHAIELFEIEHLNLKDSDYEQTRKLIQHIHPLLKTHRKLKLELNIYLKSQGLHQEYMRTENVIENPANIKAWLNSKHYEAQEMTMYTIYRQRGLSDAEASFSVRPTLSKWFALHPIRAVAVSLTGIGFLIVLLIAAISVERAKTNRKHFENPLPHGSGSTVAIADVMGHLFKKPEQSKQQPLHHDLFAKQGHEFSLPTDQCKSAMVLC